MSDPPPPQTLGFVKGLTVLFTLGALTLATHAFYNLYLHPLARVPGPFLARISGLPSWYHAYRGDRHIWLLRQFEAYGNRIRPEPDTVLFRDSQAQAEIYGMKSNVRRSRFYQAFKRADREETTMTLIDVAAHARRRRHLTACFTEKSIRAACTFVVDHVNRWLQITVEENDLDAKEWSAPIDFSAWIDALIFDIMGDLSFGRSFNIKEPGDNPLKSTPHNIASWMKFYYLMCRFPFIRLLLWLKPRGLDRVLDALTPPEARQYNQFVTDSVTRRIALQRAQSERPEAEQRHDMFHFMASARDPATGAPVYDDFELRAESNLLIIAASDTTSISLSGIIFYLTSDAARCERLTKEIRSTFSSVDEIVYGPKLSACTYLRACIDEGMRLTPSGPSELPREVLPGGLQIKGEFYDAGTIVGTVPWANSRNVEVYGADATVFRPERWLPLDPQEEPEGATPEALRRARAGFHPFLSGPGNCIGQNLAMAQMLITVARMLHRLDIRRAPGSTFGGGEAALGWGRDDPAQFQVTDAYISLRRGPEVQFRKRRD
ncbi:benzoate 4-monooxygenase cytochrome P450 [Xylaria grammica]|nr:benzoate 4-monooxygenase cytochrome P450 [Xylaria grammica]